MRLALVRRPWARSGARQSYISAEDARADGELDWMQEVQLFGDRLIRNNQIFDGGSVTWNYPVRTNCPDVIPRLATPAFRPHCPLRAFSICMLHDHQRPYIPVW